MAFGVGLMTPVPYPIAHALIGGLSADSIVRHAEALHVFPEVRLIDFDSATRDALQKTHPAHIERVWDDRREGGKSIKHEGFFIDHREMEIHAKLEKIYDALKHFIDQSDNFVEVAYTDERISVCAKGQIAGEKWIEWHVRQRKELTYLSQTVFFSPRGLPGFLYWYLLYPFHRFHLHSLLYKIAGKAMLRG
jgi:hypothetical protein